MGPWKRVEGARILRQSGEHPHLTGFRRFGYPSVSGVTRRRDSGVSVCESVRLISSCSQRPAQLVSDCLLFAPAWNARWTIEGGVGVGNDDGSGTVSDEVSRPAGPCAAGAASCAGKIPRQVTVTILQGGSEDGGAKIRNCSTRGIAG